MVWAGRIPEAGMVSKGLQPLPHGSPDSLLSSLQPAAMAADLQPWSAVPDLQVPSHALSSYGSPTSISNTACFHAGPPASSYMGPALLILNTYLRNHLLLEVLLDHLRS